VKQLNLENRVLFSQAVALREMAKIIETADLGIVPKRSDNFGNEAFSTKILEFMAVGVPVLVADTWWINITLTIPWCDFFRPANEQDLARCMLELIQNPDRRRLQAEQATRFIDKNDWTAESTSTWTLWMEWSQAKLHDKFRRAPFAFKNRNSYNEI